MELKNAVISRAWIGIEDHGILSFMLTLNYGGSAQGFGGVSLDWGKPGEKKSAPSSWIREILEVVEVPSWHELQGKSVVAIIDRGMVVGIRNYLKESLEFRPEEWFKKIGILE